MSIFSKGKLSKPQFVSKIICALLSIVLFGLFTSIKLPGDKPEEYGIMHLAVNWTFGIFMFFYIVILFRKSLDENLEFDFKDEIYGEKYYAGVGTLIIGILLMLLVSDFLTVSKHIYNKHYEYSNLQKEIQQSKKTYYDNMWKSFKVTNEIATKLNKETFIEVTKIVMGAREDKFGNSWKWVQENQPIPYNEFTKFYSDLSTFIQSQRQGYLDLEIKDQKLVRLNNTMLDIFPNCIYNSILCINHLEYKPGFTSHKTENIFKTGYED